MTRGEAWPILDYVRYAFGSPDHRPRDSVHRVVGYDLELCRLHRSLVEDMVLNMGGMEDVDHAAGWYNNWSGQGCPRSPLDYSPMGEVRVCACMCYDDDGDDDDDDGFVSAIMLTIMTSHHHISHRDTGGGGISPGENFAGKISPLRKVAKFSPGEILA